MTDVFISYARNDRHLAEDLAFFLTASGFSVWWDAELVGSDDFQEVILAALSNARATVVIWTHDSVKSSFVRDEARYALHHKKLIATKTDHLDILELPFGFQSQHTDNISNRDQIVRAIRKLGAVATSVQHSLESDGGWGSVNKLSIEDVLAWIGQNPTHPDHEIAVETAKRLVRSASAARGSSLRQEKRFHTSSFMSFVFGLFFIIPKFQLLRQGYWNSAGLSVALLFLSVICIALSLERLLDINILGAREFLTWSSQSMDRLARGVLISIPFALLTFGSWLGFNTWLNERNFVAALIVVPFMVFAAGGATFFVAAIVVFLFGGGILQASMGAVAGAAVAIGIVSSIFYVAWRLQLAR